MIFGEILTIGYFAECNTSMRVILIKYKQFIPLFGKM